MAVEQKESSWLGRSIKRKEDDRFLQGRGNYVDDVKLPDMLHMAILRSPFAHARIRSIETSEAKAAPGVVAVVTGADLVAHKLAWMPTLSGDTQAVLATDKVRMQGQEVACVIAETPYQAHDALGLIEVDYDPLPAVVTPEVSVKAEHLVHTGVPGNVAAEMLQAHTDLRPGRLKGEALGPLQNGHGGSCEDILHAKSLKIVETLNPV